MSTDEKALVLDGFYRLSEIAAANPTLFPNLRALQIFIDRNKAELLRYNALARLGGGRTSPQLVHAKRFEQLLTDMAQRKSS